MKRRFIVVALLLVFMTAAAIVWLSLPGEPKPVHFLDKEKPIFSFPDGSKLTYQIAADPDTYLTNAREELTAAGYSRSLSRGFETWESANLEFCFILGKAKYIPMLGGFRQVFAEKNKYVTVIQLKPPRQGLLERLKKLLRL
jgi:hypothetical protein